MIVHGEDSLPRVVSNTAPRPPHSHIARGFRQFLMRKPGFRNPRFKGESAELWLCPLVLMGVHRAVSPTEVSNHAFNNCQYAIKMITRGCVCSTVEAADGLWQHVTFELFFVWTPQYAVFFTTASRFHAR